MPQRRGKLGCQQDRKGNEREKGGPSGRNDLHQEQQQHEQHMFPSLQTHQRDQECHGVGIEWKRMEIIIIGSRIVVVESTAKWN